MEEPRDPSQNDEPENEAEYAPAPPPPSPFGGYEPATRTESYERFPDAVEVERSDDAEPVSDPPREYSFWDRPVEPAVAATTPRRGRWVLAWFLAALLGAGGGAAGTYFALEERSTGGSVRIVQPPITNTGTLPANPAASVARAVLPSIVRIDVRSAFGGSGLGSGVIYREDGYIITNDHVVRGADEVTVSLANGERLPAALIGTAAPRQGVGVDIAVLKVAKTGLPAATFGSAKDVHVGDLAVAIGSPFGLSATVTAGVISALHRNEIPGGGTSLTDAIQTDAPINPGNSGGALANSEGVVIGINQAIVGNSGGNVGIGFAIPIDIARKVADQIIQTGRAQLPYMGVGGESPADGSGALVTQVAAGGPADQAGLKAGDLIVGVGGSEITSFGDLIAALLEREVGQTVTLEVRRGGETIGIEVVLGQRPEG